MENKKSTLKILICSISVVLCFAIVALVCLGVALIASNGEIDALQNSQNVNNEKLVALDATNKALTAELEALESAQTSSTDEIKNLTTELAAIKEALTQSNTEQENLKKEVQELESSKETLESSKETLENSLASLKTDNQKVLSEIEQLKGDIKKANEEIAALKEQLKEQENENDGKIRIYIDQGHNPTSYHNSGAEGNGLKEEDITFSIGCILADLLRSDGRFVVELSRPNKSVVLGTDNKSSLMARVEGAATFNADYLISLHTNSYTQDTANGIEIYAANKTGESYMFGETLLNALIEATELRNRGMKENADLDILEFSDMPAILVEMGFITNATDAALLSEHPESFAEGIYNGILEYFGYLPNTLAEA